MTPLRRFGFSGLLAVLAALFLLGSTGAAHAATLDEIGADLRADNVYNDYAAENALTIWGIAARVSLWQPWELRDVVGGTPLFRHPIPGIHDAPISMAERATAERLPPTAK